MLPKLLLLAAALCAGPGLARNLPLVFEPATQPGRPDFTARGPGYTLLVARGAAAVVSPAGAARFRFAGANPHAAGEGIGELLGRLNYLIGRDPAKWRRGVSAFTRVRYREIYPGIDLEYYGSGGELEYDLVVAPGADPAAIVISVEGRGPLEVDARRDLVLGDGALRMRRPVLYQEIGGVRRQIAGGYAIRGRNRVGFRIGEYDRTKPLIIDPVLVFSTFLGGQGGENLAGASDDVTTISLAVDADGNIYAAGNTASLDFPTANPLQANFAGGVDVYVAKLDPTGSRLLYCTYLGGSDTDRAFAVAVDARGSAYIAGRTHSANLPTTPNALQRNLRSYEDGFIAKLSPDGGALVYSTFLGGSNNDDITALAVDSAGAAYVTGETQSADFPVFNAAQPRFGGRYDGWVAKLNPQGSALVYATYLGGSQGDDVHAIAVDYWGNAYVTGYTGSIDFPTLDPIQRMLASSDGSDDAFIAKLNSVGALLYSTYFGGSGDDWGVGITVDSVGSVYVTGPTLSKDFPVTSDAEQPALSGPWDAFLTKLNPSGSAASYSSYFGGSAHEAGVAVRLDAAGAPYLCGYTDSSSVQNFPGAVQPAYGGGTTDGFLAKFDPKSLRLGYFTYLGGSSTDVCLALAVDAAGNAHVAGTTGSTNFPTTTAAIQRSFGGGANDAFIAKIATTPARLLVPLPATSYTRATGFAPESLLAAFGEELCSVTIAAPAGALPTRLGGCSIRVTDSAGTARESPLYFVSSTEAYFVVPAGSALGPATVSAVKDGATPVALGAIELNQIGPGLFTASADGKGAPTAIAVRLSADGSRAWQLAFQCGAAAGSCVALPIDLGSETDQVVLQLYGSGFRGSRQSVTARVGNTNTEVLYAGPQLESEGMDRIDIHLPRSLAGRGELDLSVVADGVAANTVRVNIK